MSKISQQDEREAKSNKHSNRVIILLELSNGNIAVFNNAHTLTGVVDMLNVTTYTAEQVTDVFRFIREQFWKQPPSGLSHNLIELSTDGSSTTFPQDPIDLDKFTKE